MKNIDNIDIVPNTMQKFMYVIKMVSQIAGRKIDFLKLNIFRTAKQFFKNKLGYNITQV